MKIGRPGIHLSHKLRDQDAACINGKCIRVSKLIKNDPLLLWKAIHSRDSEISLVRPTYFKLKNKVKELYPDEVQAVYKRYMKYKTKRKLDKEIRSGVFKTSKSKFSRLKLD